MCWSQSGVFPENWRKLMSRRLFRVTFLTSLLFLAACQQVRPPTAVPTSSLASTPTLTASFTPTQRSTVTTTATASPTARPSPSVTPTASNTPSASLTPASDLLSQLATAPALPVLEHPSLPTAVLVIPKYKQSSGTVRPSRADPAYHG